MHFAKGFTAALKENFYLKERCFAKGMPKQTPKYPTKEFQLYP
jgi:hypothetical protein